MASGIPVGAVLGVLLAALVAAWAILSVSPVMAFALSGRDARAPLRSRPVHFRIAFEYPVLKR
jgi:hypothetical protein